MATDQALDGPSENCGCALTDVLMRCSVKAIALYALILSPRSRHTIPGGVLGHRAMKFGFKRRDQFHRRHRFAKRMDGCKVDGIVCGRGRKKFFERGNHAGIDEECA